MTNSFPIKSTNTILYCRRWAETVAFYKNDLKFPVNYASEWFVEFAVTPGAYISVADEQRATVKSSFGGGLTLTFQVEDIETAWQQLHERGVELGPLKNHVWGARVFYFFDPEGHRLEMWSRPK